jgi:Na+/H+-dicarboxylate symporter
MKSGTSLYVIAIVLGIICGCYDLMLSTTVFISDVFVKIFKCMSLPIITISIIVSLSQQSSEGKLKDVGKSTLFYTIMTTILAAMVACIIYSLVSPSNIKSVASSVRAGDASTGKYSEYILNIIPSSIFSPFLEHNVMGALLLGIAIGIASRYVSDSESNALNVFFRSVQRVFFVIIGWVVKILPIALFGFIATAVTQLKSGSNIKGLGEYLSIVFLANIVQGLVVLPIFLLIKKIPPVAALKAMLPALSVAFFSKSSVGTLPITMDTAEKNFGVSTKISRLVFPLCTVINMNGCAAFIFTTVIYVMQNHGINVDWLTLVKMIFVSTIAAIGNAGVPMGCFFLSMSLLTSMGIPIDLLWLILPFYGVIDMVETSLNVWSDSCVTKVIDNKFRNSLP